MIAAATAGSTLLGHSGHATEWHVLANSVILGASPAIAEK
jgi:hypothetical protein